MSATTNTARYRRRCPFNAPNNVGDCMNYYPFHLGDYSAHTSHLSWEEDIAYRRMLDWYYLNEKALPAEPSKVARLIRMPTSRAAIDAVLSEFFVLSDDGHHSKRADEELTAMQAKQEQQRTKDAHEADRLRRYRERRAEIFVSLRAMGVVPAWDVPMKDLQRLHETTCNGPATRTGALPATDLQRLSLPTPTPTPTPVLKDKPLSHGKRGTVHGFPPGFEAFWSAYPRKTAKTKAAQAFARVKPDEALLGAMLAAIAAQATWEQWEKDGGQFIPHPATWLTGRRWEDQPPMGAARSDPFAGAA